MNSLSHHNNPKKLRLYSHFSKGTRYRKAQDNIGHKYLSQDVKPSSLLPTPQGGVEVGRGGGLLKTFQTLSLWLLLHPFSKIVGIILPLISL